MVVVRSPYAHARVKSVDLDAARKADGVVAAFSAADLQDDWKAAMPCAWPVTEDMKNPPHYPLTDTARYQGEALADGAPLAHPDLGTNECYVWTLDTDATGQKLEDAEVVVTRTYYQPRLIPNAIEPRTVLAVPGPTGDLTLYAATQIPHILRLLAAATLGLSETKVRVVAPDVGGGFGSKLDVYAEDLLALALARRLDRPVKWTEERSENYVATIHGRDFVTEYTLAATKDGTITHCRARVTAAMGAYLQLVTPGIPLLGAWIYAGPYAIPNYSVEFKGAFTNTTPTDAYRGAGRPEATYVIERTMDALADELGMDKLELRRKNFIAEFPHTLASGLTVDSGDHGASLDKLLELLDLDALRAEQAKRRDNKSTKQLGVGFSTYHEMCGLAPSRILGAIRYAAGGWEQATIRYLPTGSVQVITGTSPHGQGHETAWAQIVVRRGQGDRQGARDRRALPRGRPRGPRVRQRHLHGQRLARQGDDRGCGRLGGVRRARPAGRDGARSRGDGDVRPAELLVARRRACVGRRGRHRDGRRAARPLRGGGRRRQSGQPADRRRPGARWDHAGHLHGAVRGGRVRRRGQPADGARGDQLRRRRALPPRCEGHPDAGHARACLARDPGGEGVIPARFDYDVAESVEQAIELLAAGGGDAKLLAGGHSLIPAMKLRIARPEKLVDIGRLSDLAYVKDDGTHIAIGALTRHAAVASDALLAEHCPIVSHTAGQIGDPQVRHRGTLGGTLSHGDPASDMPAVMLALGADLVARGKGGERVVPAAEFFTGVFETALAPDEVLVEARVPKLGASTGWAYLKANRRAQDWATVGVAALVHRDNGSVAGASIGLVNMGATPLRAKAAEDALAGGSTPADAAAHVTEGTEPPSDQAGSSEYRAHLAQVLTRRALEQALGA